MTTTDSRDLVFQETSTYIRTKCPDYCNLPAMHPVDNLGGEHGDFRGHGGPDFGEYLHGFAEEYTHSPGKLVVGVELSAEQYPTLTADRLRAFAENAREAAEWLEAQR